MAEFLLVTLDDGTEVVFQSAESDLVRRRGGDVEPAAVAGAVSRLEAIAKVAGRLSGTFRERVKADELELTLGVGLSGEVGWFFAKSQMDSSITLKLTWKADQKKGAADLPAGP